MVAGALQGGAGCPGTVASAAAGLGSLLSAAHLSDGGAGGTGSGIYAAAPLQQLCRHPLRSTDRPPFRCVPVPALRQVPSSGSTSLSQTAAPLGAGVGGARSNPLCPRTCTLAGPPPAHTSRGRLSHAVSRAARPCQGFWTWHPAPPQRPPRPAQLPLPALGGLSPAILIPVLRWHRPRGCFSSHSVSQGQSQDAVGLSGAGNS